MKICEQIRRFRSGQKKLASHSHMSLQHLTQSIGVHACCFQLAIVMRCPKDYPRCMPRGLLAAMAARWLKGEKLVFRCKRVRARSSTHRLSKSKFMADVPVLTL